MSILPLKTTAAQRESADVTIADILVDFSTILTALHVSHENNMCIVTTIESYERCMESLRNENIQLTAELTLAKQATADALHELRSAMIALKKVASRTYDSSTKLFEPNAAQAWLDLHAQQQKAPIMPDPEAEAEQALEAQLRD